MRLSLPIAVPKPRPAKLERDDKRKVRTKLDEAQNRLVRKRSGGRCEIHIVSAGAVSGDGQWRFGGGFWCPHRAVHVHHMIGGIGKRARRDSVLAQHKQHICGEHHQDITGDVGGKRLIRIGGPVPLWTDPYRRVR